MSLVFFFLLWIILYAIFLCVLNLGGYLPEFLSTITSLLIFFILIIINKKCKTLLKHRKKIKLTKKAYTPQFDSLESEEQQEFQNTINSTGKTRNHKKHSLYNNKFVKLKEHFHMKKSTFKVNQNMYNRNKKPIIITLITFAVIMSLFLSILCGRYSKAPKTAENATAIYLSENTISFTSFKKVYNITSLNGVYCKVKLSGSAYENTYTTTFTATVKINLLTNKATVETVAFDNRKITKK